MTARSGAVARAVGRVALLVRVREPSRQSRTEPRTKRRRGRAARAPGGLRVGGGRHHQRRRAERQRRGCCAEHEEARATAPVARSDPAPPPRRRTRRHRDERRAGSSEERTPLRFCALAHGGAQEQTLGRARSNAQRTSAPQATSTTEMASLAAAPHMRSVAPGAAHRRAWHGSARPQGLCSASASTSGRRRRCVVQASAQPGAQDLASEDLEGGVLRGRSGSLSWPPGAQASRQSCVQPSTRSSPTTRCALGRLGRGRGGRATRAPGPVARAAQDLAHVVCPHSVWSRRGCTSRVLGERRSRGTQVVVFMKGTPQFPQCGFSNTVCQVRTRCLRRRVGDDGHWPA